MERQHVLFLVKFFAILIAGYLLIAWNPVNDSVIVPFTKLVTRGAGWILVAGGQPVHTDGTVLTSAKFGINVNNGCNGVEAMLILLACVAAFPATWRARAVGLALGALMIQLLNEVRIVTLWLLGAYHPKVFQLFHTAVWQIAIILAALIFFLQWSSRVAPRLANRG